MKKILWLSDSPMMNTGYATISRNILNGLSKLGYECHFLAHNYVGQTIMPGLSFNDGLRLNFFIHGNGREAYGADIIEAKIQEIKPDIFVTLLDTFMLLQAGYQNKNFAPAKSVFYFPSDGGGGLPQGCIQILQRYGRAVAMAKYGQEQAKAVHDFDAHYIPHAVDSTLFFPLPNDEKLEAKKNLIVQGISGVQMKGFLANKFVVGCVARNQGRKMLDRTIKAFKIFSEKAPDAVLYFHCDPVDAAAVFDMRELVNRLGLANRVVFSSKRYFENFDYHDMPLIYNAMDVFFLTTSGEGFGVPTIEAMSCGIPVVITDYTTSDELVMQNGQAGFTVPMVDCNKTVAELREEGVNFKNIEDEFMTNSTLTGSWVVERGICSIPKAADYLLKLYNDRHLMEKFGKVGREKVVLHYSWKNIIAEWDDYFKEVLKDE